VAEAHGKTGSITYSNLTAGVHSWEVTYEADVPEVTDFADAGIKSYIVGGKGWTASAEANWDAANTAVTGDSAALTLTAAAGKTYTGVGIIKSMNVKVTKDDVNRVTYQFQGTGALTITLA
jgi:hypothetical protein